MKKQILYLTIIMAVSACTTLNIGKKNLPISTTNQAPTERKIVTQAPNSKTETLADGTVITTETTVYEDTKGNVTTLVNIRGGAKWDKSSDIAVADTPATQKTGVNNNPSLAIDTAPRVKPSNLPRPRNISPPPAVGGNIDSARDAAYMTKREQDMVREINLVRSNPRAYIKRVEAYKEEVKVIPYTDPNYAKTELRAADDLIRELQLTNPMSSLQPRETLYWTTQRHGIEILTNGKPSHVSNDGAYPWDRITRDDPQLEDGNENLIGGPEDVAKSVMLLLVDSGVPGYGHRKTLLNPTWKYVACYEIGDLGETPNYWVQCFAK